MTDIFSFDTSYDVVVCGGGLAGVSAALAAARSGMKTALIEKTVFTGGLATTGNVLVYLPLSDRRGRQATFGISEELLYESVKYGPGEAHAINDWSKGNQSSFNPASFILRLDELLVENNIDIWFDSLVCGVQQENDWLTAVEIENKSGRGIVRAKAFIDATGDADIAFRAGEQCATQLNFMSIWATEASPEMAKSLLQDSGCSSKQLLAVFGAWDSGSNHPEGMKKFNGVDSKDVSEFIVTGRRLMRERYIQKQNDLGPDGRSKCFPMGLPAMANFRTTRRIEAQYVIGNDEQFKHFDDCVGLVVDWKKGEDIWELPYRSMLPCKNKNLICAGRCIGTQDSAWSVFRVIQGAAMSGEVAGLAAALSVDRDVSLDALPVSDIQMELKKRNFILDVRELYSINPQ